MLDALVDTFGPFLIPVALFIAGIVAYVALAVSQRYWLQQAKTE